MNANIKAARGGEGCGLFRRETGAAFQRFVLAIIGVGGFGVLQRLALAVQALGEHFAGVGVGKVYRAGADAADLVQNRLDLPVFLPQGVLAGHLAVVLFHVVVARPGDKPGWDSWTGCGCNRSSTGQGGGRSCSAGRPACHGKKR